ncbi:hypothetical protein KEM54_001863 [Ascosphaera aggregata]|nr:hypothetical protein KEM54_001863 [Ascosphaera aggregata]
MTTAVNPAASKPSASATVQKPVAPTSIFSSLMSASKKPGTSNAARAAAAAAAEEKGEAKKSTSAPKPPAFSFSETMADLTKPKEAAPAARDSKQSDNETEEDRAARVKKEKKQRLRVKFKPEAQLVEVRYFTHDPEEEIRADPSMIKDVDDVGGEGRMLKLHLGDDDLDDDDDVAEMKEEDIRPWPSLVAIDFSVLSDKERSENFIKYGGTQIPRSAEKLAQEQREANSLPPLRTSLADIPETPKEPPEEDDKAGGEPTMFGEPNELVKARSDQYYESRSPQSSSGSPPIGLAAPNTASTNNLSSLLNLLSSGALQTNNLAAQSNPLTDLEKTFSQFRTPAAVPTAPAASLQPQAPAPAFNGLDINKLLAVIGASQQMGLAAPAIQPQQPAVPTPDASTILSQITGVNGFGQTPPSVPAAGLGYGAATQQQNQIYENEDRKRMREEGLVHEGQSKRSKNGSEGKKKTDKSEAEDRETVGLNLKACPERGNFVTGTRGVRSGPVPDAELSFGSTRRHTWVSVQWLTRHLARDGAAPSQWDCQMNCWA